MTDFSHFHEIRGLVDYGPKKTWLNFGSDREHLDILSYLSCAVRLSVDVKSESDVEKISYGQCGKYRPMYLLLAVNDTVPVSVWRGGGLRSAECSLF